MAVEGAAIAEEAGTRRVCQQVGSLLGAWLVPKVTAQVTRGSENKGRKARPEVTLSARQKPDQARPVCTRHPLRAPH